jgi:deoxyribose-phosphate aldolase
MLSPADLARCTELTLTAPAAGRAQVEALCALALKHKVYGVCVNGSQVESAYALLEESNLKVTGFVGFPLGMMDADVKRYETEVAIDHGAHEIEVVLNIGRLKDGDFKYVLRELRDIAEAADERPVKVELQSHVLTVEEQRTACELALDSGVRFVNAGDTLAGVKRLRELVGPTFGVKAAGQSIDFALATALIEAGATRIGLYQLWQAAEGPPKAT